MKSGHTTPSLLIGKLHASSRQSSLAKALHEYGRLIRTIYVCRYIADEELRRRVRRQLNKGGGMGPPAAEPAGNGQIVSGRSSGRHRAVPMSAVTRQQVPSGPFAFMPEDFRHRGPSSGRVTA